jgi:hypothetical protein
LRISENWIGVKTEKAKRIERKKRRKKEKAKRIVRFVREKDLIKSKQSNTKRFETVFLS